MPEHIIKFNLPEEQPELDIFMNSAKYYCCLEEIDSFLRSKTKYENVHESYVNMRAHFNEILEKFDVTLG